MTEQYVHLLNMQIVPSP